MFYFLLDGDLNKIYFFILINNKSKLIQFSKTTIIIAIKAVTISLHRIPQQTIQIVQKQNKFIILICSLQTDSKKLEIDGSLKFFNNFNN